MKSFIILATLLLATTAFADQAYMKLGDIKGEAKDTESLVVEGDLMNGVIDNEENAAEEVKDAVHQPSGSATGQARRRADVVMKDVTVESKRNEIANTKATDHNSSRSNKTSSSRADRTTHDTTGNLIDQHRKLDEDSDNDGVDTEACNAVDNDCDDARAERSKKGYDYYKSKSDTDASQADNNSTKSGSINTIKSSCTLEEKLKGNKICPKD